MSTAEREKLRQLALVWGAELGPAGLQRVVGHFGSAAAALAAGVPALSNPGLRLSAEQVALIPTLGHRLADFERELEDLRRENITVVCPWEPDYPALLRDLRNPPPVLCIAGALLPQDGQAIAVVGTRTPSAEGHDMARRLGKAFAETGTTVVSGLARGCDTAAHLGALECGGRTVAVLGSGIRVVTPRENLDLAREISQRGAVVSEQPPGAQPTTGRLMARNRLQSGLSRAVLVVESREQGGALETARQAVEQGRGLYAVRWATPKPEAAGCNKLLSEGARAVSGPEQAEQIRLELVDHLARLKQQRASASTQQGLFGDEPV